MGFRRTFNTSYLGTLISKIITTTVIVTIKIIIIIINVFYLKIKNQEEKVNNLQDIEIEST